VPVAPLARDQVPRANVTEATVPEGIPVRGAEAMTQLIIDVVPAALQVDDKEA